MYCGDETGAFIGDVSSSTSRFGYGGEDHPKYVAPSHVYAPPRATKPTAAAAAAAASAAVVVPTSTLRPPPDGFDVRTAFERPSSSSSSLSSSSNEFWTDPNVYPMGDGVVDDWDAYESLWSSSFDALCVRDSLKHTSGGGGGGGFGGGGGGGASVVGGRGGKRRSGEEDGPEEDGRCGHPLLATESGHTHLVSSSGDGGASSSSSSHQASLRLSQRVRTLELLFEKFDAPAVFLAPTPILIAFSVGRQTGLVVDVGGRGSRATPVVDGLILERSQRRSGRGGDWLGEVQRKALKVGWDIDVEPRYALRRRRRRRRRGGKRGGREEEEGNAKTKEGGGGGIERRGATAADATDDADRWFRRMAVTDVMYEMKTSEHVRLEGRRTEGWTVPFLDLRPPAAGGGNDGDGDDDDAGGVEDESDGGGGSDDDEEEEEEGGERAKEYELPDGTKIQLKKDRRGKDLRRLPELFFSDRVPFAKGANDDASEPSTAAASAAAAFFFNGAASRSTSSSSFGGTESTVVDLPLHRLVRSSLSSVSDGDVRKELCGNILLSGGSSLYRNLDCRLSSELSDVVPATYKCRVVASRNSIERRYGAWIGGSVLTSLGSFQQLWLSRAEYEEYGAALGTKRFP